VWVVLAVTGWVLALIAWTILARALWPAPPAVPRVGPFVDGRIVELRAADGTLESVRQIRGSDPPAEIVRPHGRHATTTYKQVSRDGSRWIYSAER
jgi:hypothetical protein